MQGLPEKWGVPMAVPGIVLQLNTLLIKQGRGHLPLRDRRNQILGIGSIMIRIRLWMPWSVRTIPNAESSSTVPENLPPCRTGWQKWKPMSPPVSSDYTGNSRIYKRLFATITLLNQAKWPSR